MKNRAHSWRVAEFVCENVVRFAYHGGGLKLRSYQEGPGRAIVESVIEQKGLTFVVMFPRQSGKNELQAQIEAYLLARYAPVGGEMVKVSPTWKPQSLNAMRRLERALQSNFVTRRRWIKEQGYIYRMGQARVFFLSGGKEANIVGATATLLLAVDEAQDVLTEKYDKEIAPMAASTNATRVFWGTAWTAETLLGRELRAALEAERADGQRRVFLLTAETVRTEVAAYGKFVDEQVRRLGRNHPMVRTQFFSEELGAAGGLFPEERRALMQGEHPWEREPQAGAINAFLIDVAGEDEQEGSLGVSSSRDATALTVVRVDLNSTTEGGQGPVYRVVQRKQWVGVKHARLFEELRGLAERWGARRVVIDATGVGSGLASFLEQALPGRVVRFVFSVGSKSQLGWDFLSVVETGRYKEYRAEGVEVFVDGMEDLKGLQEVFWRQCRQCQGEALPGPGKVLHWGVPDGRREAGTGELVHDDLLVSAALCAVLERERWGEARSVMIPPRDVFEGMGW